MSNELISQWKHAMIGSIQMKKYCLLLHPQLMNLNSNIYYLSNILSVFFVALDNCLLWCCFITEKSISMWHGYNVVNIILRRICILTHHYFHFLQVETTMSKAASQSCILLMIKFHTYLNMTGSRIHGYFLSAFLHYISAGWSALPVCKCTLTKSTPEHK